MSFRAFSGLLKARRKELGYSQERLAMLSGVKQETIQKIEALSVKDTRASTLFKLAKALKWNGEQILKAWNGKAPTLDTVDDKIKEYETAIEDFYKRIKEIRSN